MSIALFFLFLLLPAYVVRFHIGPLPTTLLEVMVWVVIIFNFQFFRQRRTPTASRVGAISKQFPNSLILKHRLLFVGITLFFLGATIGVFVSSDTRAALGEWKAFYLEPIIIFFIVTSYFNQNTGTKKSRQIFNAQFSIFKQFSNSLILPLIFSGLVVSTFAIYQHFTGFGVPYSFWGNGNTFRVTAWYGYPNAVGLFLAPLIPLAIYVAKESWNVLRNKIKELRITEFSNSSILQFFTLTSSILFLITSPFAIIFAKGSGPFIGVAVGIASILFFHPKTRFAVSLVSLVGIVCLVSLPQPNPIHQELLADNRSGRIRQAIWHETARFLADHPIAGAGLASYSQKIIPYHTTVDGEGIEIFSLPHNLFLSIWVNTGLIGLVGFILMLIWFFRTAWQITPSTFNLQPSTFFVASMLTLLTMGIVDTPYIKNDLSIFFWLLIALMYLEQSQPRQSLPHPTA